MYTETYCVLGAINTAEEIKHGCFPYRAYGPVAHDHWPLLEARAIVSIYDFFLQTLLLLLTKIPSLVFTCPSFLSVWDPQILPPLKNFSSNLRVLRAWFWASAKLYPVWWPELLKLTFVAQSYSSIVRRIWIPILISSNTIIHPPAITHTHTC